MAAMTKHWKRSRITKAFTDASRVNSFREAEARLDAVHVAVVVGADQLATVAGQAAALTAIVTARKCFGRVTLVSATDAALASRLPLGDTLQRAARRLGARISETPPAKTTHTIIIGDTPRGNRWSVHCWWHRWLSGTRARGESLGDSRLSLSGVFAAALAVRQVFAGVLAGRHLRPRDATISLWTPWMGVDRSNIGPQALDVPDKFWILGLGHLGQGFIWNLCFLGAEGGRAIVQDDQPIGEENEATSVLVSNDDIGENKTRIASRWLSAAGWKADIIERRHHGDIQLNPDDPPYLLSGLDRIEPRRIMANHGFDYMIDAGLGHGPHDFEAIQLRVITKGAPFDDLWSDTDPTLEAVSSDRQAGAAYKDLERHIGQCGTVSFAEASTSVPFVGAATGALVIAQAIRLASLEPTARFLQIALGAPEMMTVADFVNRPSVNVGSLALQLR
jgi:hypothetical protein